MLSLLFAAILSISEAGEYRDLDDIKFTAEIGRVVEIDLHGKVWPGLAHVPTGFHVVYYRMDEDGFERYNKEWMLSELSRNLSYINEWADDHNYPKKTCLSTDKVRLEIYLLTEPAMDANARKDLSWAKNYEDGDAGQVVGLFDPVKFDDNGNIVNYSALKFAPDPKYYYMTRMTLAHELYHYIYYRFCWNQHGDSKNPEVAVEAFMKWAIANKDY